MVEEKEEDEEEEKERRRRGRMKVRPRRQSKRRFYVHCLWIISVEQSTKGQSCGPRR